jgi:hypothetical protein
MTVTIDGSAGVTTNSGAVYNGLQASTAQVTTSGTSIDFTGVPSWAKRVTVMFNGVSNSGASNMMVQLGAGSIQATGYKSVASNSGTAVANTTGFLVTTAVVAASLYSGLATFMLISGNIWVMASVIAQDQTGGAGGSTAGGTVTLTGTLDRLRLTSVTGTDAFDAGSVNIIYE